MENITEFYDGNSSIDIALSILTITISSIGVVANTVLLYLFIFDPFFRKMIYYLMSICCFTDLITNITTVVSYSVFQMTNISLKDATTLCLIFMSIILSSYGISIMNLCLMAIYRYISIVKPFSNFNLQHKKRFVIASEIFIWLVCLSGIMPDNSYIEARMSHKAMCDYTAITPAVSTYLFIYVFIYFILPSAIITIFYWRIIVHQRNHIRPGRPSVHDGQILHRKDRSVKSLILISASFVLTTWPTFALLFGIAITRNTYIDILFEDETYFWLSMFAISTTPLVAVINPFLYLKFDSNIRCRFKNRFFKRSHFFTLIKVTSDAIYPSSNN